MIRKVIDELKKYTVGKKNTEKTEISVLALNRFISALEMQEPKTGHWIFYGRLLKCSNCGYIHDDILDECPNCGAKMD